MKTMQLSLGMIACVSLLASGCGRLAEGEDREPFGSLGDAEAGDDNDDLGEDPGSGGELSESCFDEIVQPGELCHVQAPAPIDAGIDPCSLEVADFDGDGRPDIAVPNSDFWMPPGGTHVANVLRGYGDGDFAPTEAHAAGEELPVGLAVGDFDGDGRVDMATANNEAQKAFLMRNLSGGGGGMSFAAPEGVGVSSVASSAIGGDFDNDGIDDMVVNTPGGVALLRGGPAGFTLLEVLDVGGTSMHSELVDLDEDGNLDLVAAVMTNESGEGRVVVLQGAGDGSFPRRVEHPLTGSPWWVVAEDLNMDGDLDLVVADYGANKVAILLGNAQGGFSPRTEIDVCGGPQSVAVGDLNLDGANDIVVGCMDSDRVEIWVQVEDGVFDLTRWFGTGSRPVSVQLADFNLDGIDDLAWANQYGNTVGLAISRP